MERRALSALELPRVLSYLAAFAVSEAGQKACLALRPFSDLERTRREAALFEQGRLWLLRSVEKPAPFPPIDSLLSYVESPHAVLDLDGLWGLRQVLVQARLLVESLRGGAEQGLWPLWIERVNELSLPVKSMSGLARCLSDDGLLRDEASPELSLVRAELRRLHQQCVRKVKDFATEYNILHYLQDAFMTLSSDRYVLPLKANFKGRLQGVIHDYSQTGETCYFEPLFLVEMNNRLQGLKREEREEERKILTYLSSLVREELPGVRSAYDFLVDVDLLHARSALGDCYDGRVVEFDEGRGVFLREARHPLLALAASPRARKALHRYMQDQLAQQGGQPSDASGDARDGAMDDTGDASAASAASESDARPSPRESGSGSGRGGEKSRGSGVVPSSLELLPGQRALVISGGNAGGKTVCLKTLGLISLMGMCALPVPVEAGSVLPAWQRIHAFIGDEQSLDDNVSTYTAQITHLARIWPELGPDSLVILDEFGAGTDPSQGAALAQAVVDSIMERGAFVVAATHFPALKAYALSAPGVRAASVLFDPKTRKPLFRLVYDQVGASQALDVAREHGLPEEVLRRAEKYLLLSGEDTSTLVDRLNSLAVEREGELASLAREKAAFAEKRRRLEERFEKERERLFSSVQADAQKVLTDWKASRISHKQALKELSRIRGPLAREAAGKREVAALPAVDLAELYVRQKVRHIPWKRAGVVQEIDLRKKRVRLDFDGVSLWAEAADIAPVDGAVPPASSGKGSPSASGAQPRPAKDGSPAAILPLRLDLRGMRADVAINELEKFLDRALLSGRSEVEVIHGRGTGVLRRELHAFLKTSPAAGAYRLAPEDQGGDGMTIVELK